MPWLPSRTHSCVGSGVVSELAEDRVDDLPLGHVVVPGSPVDRPALVLGANVERHSRRVDQSRHGPHRCRTLRGSRGSRDRDRRTDGRTSATRSAAARPRWRSRSRPAPTRRWGGSRAAVDLLRVEEGLLLGRRCVLGHPGGVQHGPAVAAKHSDHCLVVVDHRDDPRGTPDAT